MEREWDEGSKGNILAESRGGRGRGTERNRELLAENPSIGWSMPNVGNGDFNGMGQVSGSGRKVAKERSFAWRWRKARKKGGGGVRCRRSLKGGIDAIADSPKRNEKKQNKTRRGGINTRRTYLFSGFFSWTRGVHRLARVQMHSKLSVPNNYSVTNNRLSNQIICINPLARTGGVLEDVEEMQDEPSGKEGGHAAGVEADEHRDAFNEFLLDDGVGATVEEVGEEKDQVGDLGDDEEGIPRRDVVREDVIER